MRQLSSGYLRLKKHQAPPTHLPPAPPLPLIPHVPPTRCRCVCGCHGCAQGVEGGGGRCSSTHSTQHTDIQHTHAHTHARTHARTHTRTRTHTHSTVARDQAPTPLPQKVRGSVNGSPAWSAQHSAWQPSMVCTAQLAKKGGCLSPQPSPAPYCPCPTSLHMYVPPEGPLHTSHTALVDDWYRQDLVRTDDRLLHETPAGAKGVL